MPSAIKLLVGLGNPGPAYLLTRHNAGFWFADALAAKHGLRFRGEAKFNAEVARLALGNGDCYLCKPSRFMNDSGRAVQALASFYRLAPEELLIVHDEIDLAPGTVRLKQGGGHGGHNGLRDIIEALGDNNFNRLRIGVGHPGDSDQVADYVLSRAPAAEEELILQGIAAALELVPEILAGDMARAMNKLHSSEKHANGINNDDKQD